MNICFFPFYIDSKSHHFKIMNFFKKNHEFFSKNHNFFLKNHEFLQKHAIFRITRFQKSHYFRITRFQKSHYFKITRFQNHIISKITLFSKSRDFYHSLLFLKLPCFKKNSRSKFILEFPV